MWHPFTTCYKVTSDPNTIFVRTPRYVKFPCVECIYEEPCFPSRVCITYVSALYSYFKQRSIWWLYWLYVSTLSVLRPFVYSYRYEGFWIPLMSVWPEYRTYDTWEYILTFFLLLACWTDFRIWIACDVSASSMAVINSVVYLKAAVGNSEPTRLNWTPSRHVLRVFHTFSQGWTTHSSSLTWPWKMKNELRRMK